VPDIIYGFVISLITLAVLKVNKAEHLYSALHGIQTTLKRLRRITQLLTCKEHHASLYLVSVHQMAPPVNVVVDI